MHLEEFAVIDNASDDIVHVVGLVRIVRDDLVQCVVSPADRVIGRNNRSLLHIVLRNVAEELLYDADAVLIVLCREMCHTALGGMNARAAKVLRGHCLAGHALDHCRACKEHVRSVLHHDGEVGQCR